MTDDRNVNPHETEEEPIEIEEFQDEPESKVDNPADVLRVEKDLHVSWSGVRGCCSGNRPQNEVTGVFNTWRGNMIAQHSNRRYLNSGHGGGTARCSSSGGGGWPNPPASCRGGVTVKAWIEFL